MNKILKILIFIFTILLLVSCNVIIENEKENETVPTDYFADSESVDVERYKEFYSFSPIDSYKKAVILVPKDNITPESYVILSRELAEKGYLSILLRSSKVTESTINQILYFYKGVLEWYIGGHSSGGQNVTKYLESHFEDFKGYFLLAAFSNVDLSEKYLKTLTIYGTNDKLLNLVTYEAKLPNLGSHYIEHIIEGANHYNFADCEPSSLDGIATITAEEQMKIAANYIIELINSPTIKKEEEPDIETALPERTYNVTYEESIDTFKSPDIGFYHPQLITTSKTTVSDIKNEYLYYNSLVHLRIDLSEFSSKYNGNKDLDLTTEMLNKLDSLFARIERSGACAIVRFAYDHNFDGNENMEPSLTMIKKHIQQFSPVINKYKNMITAVECGLIGPWGEMHSSDLATQSTFNVIINQYLTSLDKDVVILLRRPEMVYKYYGLTLKTIDKYNFTNNRLGCYNDGYLGSSSDLGTFEDREIEVEFLEKLTANTPYGGEVTVPSSKYTYLTRSCSEMFKTNLCYLNYDWNKEVIDRWSNTSYTLDDPLYEGQSELKYIENHMGYRFVCESLECNVSNKVSIKLQLKNVGFGELFKNKTGFVILKNNEKEYVFSFEYNNELLIEESFNISNLPTGDYELYLVLADAYNGQAIRGIQFANKNMFNESMKANKLLDLTI